MTDSEAAAATETHQAPLPRVGVPPAGRTATDSRSPPASTATVEVDAEGSGGQSVPSSPAEPVETEPEGRGERMAA